MARAIQSTQRLPFFSQNQVLRAEDLNTLVEELMNQLQQNRLFVEGYGVKQGFEVSLTEDGDGKLCLLVEKGTGVSSDGFVLNSIEDCLLKNFKPAELTDCIPPKGECAERFQSLVKIAKYELTEALTKLEEIDNETNPTWKNLAELPRPKKTYPSGRLEGQKELAGYCLVILRCESIRRRQRCFDDCEEKGADREVDLKFLLVSEADYRAYLTAAEESGSAGATPSLPEVPRLPRFGIDTEINCIDFCSINGAAEFYAKYEEALSGSLFTIENVMKSSYEEYYVPIAGRDTGYEERIKNFQANFREKVKELNRLVAADSCSELQYLYSYLQELTLAYASFRSVAIQTTVGAEERQNLTVCERPRHLVVASLTFPVGVGDGDGFTVSRGKCYSEQVNAVADPLNKERLRILSQRFDLLMALLDSANLNIPTPKRGEPDIRLTPEARRFAHLDGRALPFYYDPSLKNIWADTSWRYQGPVYQYEAKGKAHPALSAVPDYDFYRIEGHIGQDLAIARNRIELVRQDYNLAFDIKEVWLEDHKALANLYGEEFELRVGALEDWYRNTRDDLLCKLDGIKRIFGDGDIPVFLANVINALKAESLGAFDGEVRLIPGEADCCDATFERPEEWTAFIDNYDEFIKEYEKQFDPTKGLSSYWPAFGVDTAVQIVNSLVDYHKFRIEFQRSLSFKCFAKEHPGLEPMNGVPRGGTFVLVNILERDRDEKQRKITGKVVADFCLPYLCCGNQIVVRNEIVEVKPELKVVNEPLCFLVEEGAGNLANVEAKPDGGTLKVSLGNEEETYEQVQGVIPVDLNNIIDPTDPEKIKEAFGSDGKAQLNLEYQLENGRTIRTIADVHYMPNCQGFIDELKAGEVYEPRYDENCRMIGRRALFRFFQPLPRFATNGLKAFLDGTQISDEVFKESWIPEDGDQLEGFYVPLSSEGRVLRIENENGPCGCEFELTLPSYCIFDSRFSRYGRYKPKSIEATYVDLPNTLDGKEVNVKLDQSATGFLTFHIVETGLDLRTFLVVPSGEGGDVEVRRTLDLYRVFTPDRKADDCNQHARYVVVYSRALFKKYYEELEVDQRNKLPFNYEDVLELFDLTNVDLLNHKIRLRYFSDLEGCDPAELANLTITFSSDEVVFVTSEDEELEKARLLNARQSEHRKELENIVASTAALKEDAEAVKNSKLYMSLGGAASGPNDRFKSAMTSLKQLSAENASSKKAAVKIGKLVAINYLDKLAALPPDGKFTDKGYELSTKEEGMVKTLREALDELGAGKSAVSSQWKVGKLRRVMDKNGDRRLTAINNALKAK